MPFSKHSSASVPKVSWASSTPSISSVLSLNWRRNRSRPDARSRLMAGTKEERKLPTARRHLDRMHRVFRNNHGHVSLGHNSHSSMSPSMTLMTGMTGSGVRTLQVGPPLPRRRLCFTQKETLGDPFATWSSKASRLRRQCLRSVRMLFSGPAKSMKGSPDPGRRARSPAKGEKGKFFQKGLARTGLSSEGPLSVGFCATCAATVGCGCPRGDRDLSRPLHVSGPRADWTARTSWMTLFMVHFALQHSREKSPLLEGVRTSKPGAKTDGFMNRGVSMLNGAGPCRMPGACKPSLRIPWPRPIERVSCS